MARKVVLLVVAGALTLLAAATAVVLVENAPRDPLADGLTLPLLRADVGPRTGETILASAADAVLADTAWMMSMERKAVIADHDLRPSAAVLLVVAGASAPKLLLVDANSITLRLGPAPADSAAIPPHVVVAASQDVWRLHFRASECTFGYTSPNGDPEADPDFITSLRDDAFHLTASAPCWNEPMTFRREAGWSWASVSPS